LSSEPANAAVVVLTGALVWAGSSLLQQILLISDVIFAAAVKCSFVTVHAPALRPHRAPVTGFIAMSLHLHEVCLQQIEGRADAMSHRQWIGGLHVEEDVAVPLPTNQRRATPTAVLPLSFPRCAVEAVVGNSGGHGRQHHGPVDRQPEDCKAVRMLAP